MLYVGLVLAQYLAASGLLHDPWLAANALTLPPRSAAQYIVALNVFGFFAVALLERIARRARADSRRAAGAGVHGRSPICRR